MTAATADDRKRKSVVYTTLGLAKDGVKLAKPAVSAGFSIAHACVDAGFWIPKRCILFRSPVDLAHSIARSSLNFSSMIAQSSLEASDRVLSLVGGEDGETYRLLAEYVESQSHTDGHNTREALLGLSALLVEVGQELSVTNPLQLIKGAQKLTVIHETQRQERIAKRQQDTSDVTDWTTSLYMQYATAIYGAQAAVMGCCGTTVDEHDIIIPHPSELTSLSRHMRYAAAAYGAKSLKFMGCCDSLGYLASDKDAILSLTGINQSDVLYMAQERLELYHPAHFVAADHNNEEVVVAIRGTMSIHDVLVDLVCQSDDFVWDDDGTLGKAHGGFLKSARVLSKGLHELVTTALEEHPNYDLVIVGHSLGGGVATLLALLWARMPEFRKHNVRAISYASPCVVCEKVSQAPFTRRHVTSVVTGDDIVSRFGLSTFRELQRNMTALANDDDNENVSNTSGFVPVRKDNNEEKLYCAGRVWWLESKEYEPHPIVEVDPVKELYEIGLFSDMFAIHLPKAYLDSLDKLDKRH